MGLRCGNLPVLIILAFFLCLAFTEAHAQSDDNTRKGVFTGDHMGCESKSDLIAYYDANDAGDRKTTGELVSQKKCMKIIGRTYVPLRVGFVAARVLVTIHGKDIELWVRTAAVVESPPPPRETHFNF